MRYADRADAGRRLGPDVGSVIADQSQGDHPPLILGVPRGGVVVASEIAEQLGADLDVALARKIGAPYNPELAIGAVGETGEPFLAFDLIHQLGVPDTYVESATDQARTELLRRASEYRGDLPAPSATGRVAVVVDDGIATGATLRATLQAIRRQSPAFLICAVPVGPPDSVAAIGKEVDAMVCPLRPRWFRAVGEWYETFTQTRDEEVVALLQRARTRSSWRRDRGDQ